MRKFALVFFIATKLFASFYDEELEQLWSQIEDINHPTLEEYQLIDRYLSMGARPYLDLLRKADPPCPERLKRILDLKLIGPENEMPLFETHAIHVNEFTKKRCIVLYGSYNGIHPEKAKNLLFEIKNCGYSGHVLLRIGGFPNAPFGGLKICHVPYAFKVAFLQEAKWLGYRQVLWIDLALHPISDFEEVFSEIEEKGCCFTYVGTLQDNVSTHLPKAAKALGITLDLYDQIPHLSSSIIGLNLENGHALRLLETWYKATESVYPSLTWWPEELSLSVAAWRSGCMPFTWFGNLVCTESEQSQLEERPTVQFYLDSVR